jgi:aconitase A
MDNLTLADRATIANMGPEYGATQVTPSLSTLPL